MRSLSFAFFILTLSTPALAALPKGVSVTVEPIVGYELQRKSDPERTKLVLVYGARAIAGYKILSGEVEYTRGQSDETFGTPTTQVEETSEKIRAGLRSQKDLGKILSLTLRGGAEAGRRNTKTTVNSVTTESESPTKVDPYLGTGLALNLGTQISLTAEAVATIKDTKDMKKNEYATTFGLRVNFNAR